MTLEERNSIIKAFDELQTIGIDIALKVDDLNEEKNRLAVHGLAKMAEDLSILIDEFEDLINRLEDIAYSDDYFSFEEGGAE